MTKKKELLRFNICGLKQAKARVIFGHIDYRMCVMNEEKMRPQLLETPYKLQDVCPTRKLRAPEDTLRRIQKKIAFAEKNGTGPLEMMENKPVNSTENETLPFEKQVTVLPVRTADSSWLYEFRKSYGHKWKKLAKQREGGKGNFDAEWYTVSEMFHRIALAYSNDVQDS